MDWDPSSSGRVWLEYLHYTFQVPSMSFTDLCGALLGQPVRAERLSFLVSDGSALMVWEQPPLPSLCLAFVLRELRGGSPCFIASLTLLPCWQHMEMPDRKVGDAGLFSTRLTLWSRGSRRCTGGHLLLHTHPLHPARSHGSPDVRPAAGLEAGA